MGAHPEGEAGFHEVRRLFDGFGEGRVGYLVAQTRRKLWVR